ncbi:8-amino-7-oxononanoate synthase [Corynebacterium sp. 13CS0277]|nr:8-amino-7-oxononanoate synthase [Corynebacterium sp. 13CS0277]
MTLLSSSNYLGLSTHPRVVAAAEAALRRFGCGSGGSRLTTGTTELHAALEARLAEFFHAPDAVFFATGYQANLSALQVLVDEDTTVFSDAANHASIIDGLRLAGARKVIYPHGTLPDTTGVERALIVSDGVFSMDGDTADIAGLRGRGELYIDDAHATGTLGATGRGHLEGCTTWGEGYPDVVVGTASKALGAEGGFVLTDGDTATLLRNQARSFVFSTATPAATCAAVCAALDVIDSEDVVARLQGNIRVLSDALLHYSLIPAPATTPIIPIPIGAEQAAVAASQRLLEAGFFVPAIRYPTVPRGAAILRVTVMATHTPAELEDFAAVLSSTTQETATASAR